MTINWVKAGWKDVTPVTITNSFRKAYFDRDTVSQTTIDIVESDSEDVLTIGSLLREMDEEIDENDYVSLDNDLPIAEPSVEEDSYDADRN